MDKLLIVSKNHPEINADLEIKTIEAALAKTAGIAVIDPRSLEPHEVVTVIREHSPTALHFISHGELRQGGNLPVVILSSRFGGEEDLELPQLVHYLVELADEESKRFKCIFLNACYVGISAEDLLECADVVVGTKCELPESTAQFFAGKFYEHVALGCSLGQAYRDAKHATKLARGGGDQIFILSNPVHVADETFLGESKAIERRAPHRWDAFMSYAPADSEVAHALAAELFSLGLDVFLDVWERGKGEIGTNRLDAGIHGSRSGILVVSAEAMKDPLVGEQYHALLRNAVNDASRRLIPAVFGDAEMPPFLAIREPADFRGKKGDEYAKELEQLRRGVLGLPSVDKPLRHA